MFRAGTLLGAPGVATRNKKLLGAPGLTTRSKDATRGSWPYYILFTLHAVKVGRKRGQCHWEIGDCLEFEDDFYNAPDRHFLSHFSVEIVYEQKL